MIRTKISFSSEGVPYNTCKEPSHSISLITHNLHVYRKCPCIYSGFYPLKGQYDTKPFSYGMTYWSVNNAHPQLSFWKKELKLLWPGRILMLEDNSTLLTEACFVLFWTRNGQKSSCFLCLPYVCPLLNYEVLWLKLISIWLAMSLRSIKFCPSPLYVLYGM